jgi:hypothetical protein
MTISKKFLSQKVAAGLMLALLLMAVPAHIVGGPNNKSEQAQLMLQLKEEIAAMKKEQKKQRTHVYKVAAGTALATLASAAGLKYAYDNGKLVLPTLPVAELEKALAGAGQVGKFGGYAALTAGSLGFVLPAAFNLALVGCMCGPSNDANAFAIAAVFVTVAGSYGILKGIDGMISVITGK